MHVIPPYAAPCFTASILTILPDMFPGTLGHSLLGKALSAGLWKLETVDIRKFAKDKHHSVDDTPYGGGAGMVMRADVVANAVAAAAANKPQARHIYLSPRGRLLTQELAVELGRSPALILLCGRYEGVDQRVLDSCQFEEISIGDYVLAGGEVAAMVLLEAVVRLLPGVLGNAETHAEESHASGLLEYPHYTRPQIWNGQAIPEILISGHHEKVRAWCQAQSELLTEQRRPDLWARWHKKTDITSSKS